MHQRKSYLLTILDLPFVMVMGEENSIFNSETIYSTKEKEKLLHSLHIFE